jgi:hypothetical protein
MKMDWITAQTEAHTQDGLHDDEWTNNNGHANENGSDDCTNI